MHFVWQWKNNESQIPERAEYIRVLVAELNRIASHLILFGTYGVDIGAVTPFMYALRERNDFGFI